MGFFDKIRQGGEDLIRNSKLQSLAKSGGAFSEEDRLFFIEKNSKTPEEYKLGYDERIAEQKRLMELRNGERTINLPGFSIREDKDGLYYFGSSFNEFPEKYFITSFEWGGINYVVDSITKTTGKNKTGGRVGGTLIGAGIGAMINPVGAIIGGLAGSSGKKTTKVNEQSKTFGKQREVASDAMLVFMNSETLKKEVKKFKCDSKVAEIVHTLYFTPEDYIRGMKAEETEPNILSDGTNEIIDPYEELKKLKELVDIGVITQEEFDVKKKQLLGI